MMEYNDEVNTDEYELISIPEVRFSTVKHCKKCGTTERYEKNGKCIACAKARNAKSNAKNNAKNNAKRTKEERAAEYNQGQTGLTYSDNFQRNAVVRAGCVETLGEVKDQMILRLMLKILRKNKINGVGQKSAKWTLDHIYPIDGEIVDGKKRVGLTTMANLEIVEVGVNKAKKNKVSQLGAFVEVEAQQVDLLKGKKADEIRELIQTRMNYDSKNNEYKQDLYPLTDKDEDWMNYEDTVVEIDGVRCYWVEWDNTYAPYTNDWNPLTHRFEYIEAIDDVGLVRFANDYSKKKDDHKDKEVAAWTQAEVDAFTTKLDELKKLGSIDDVYREVLAFAASQL